jgi:hypothetical protein
MEVKNNWQLTLATLVQFNIEGLKYYQDFADEKSDQAIQAFVFSNLNHMSKIYRLGVVACLTMLSLLFAVTHGRSINRLNQAERAEKLPRYLRFFPFDLLNRLICGNIFMRLFELKPQSVKS